MFFSLKLNYLLKYWMHIINLPLVLFFHSSPLPIIFPGWKFWSLSWYMLFYYLNPFSSFWFILQWRPKSYTWTNRQGIVWHSLHLQFHHTPCFPSLFLLQHLCLYYSFSYVHSPHIVTVLKLTFLKVEKIKRIEQPKSICMKIKFLKI